MRMAIGCNLPYTDQQLPDSTLRLIDALAPEEFTLTSFMDGGDLAAVASKYPDALYHVRPRTGPTGQPWTQVYEAQGANVLSFRSWDTERSLADCLDTLAATLPALLTPTGGPRVTVLMGNEPRLEWAPPWPNAEQVEQAAIEYAQWFHVQVGIIREAYPWVGIAVAPLDEGDPEAAWHMADVWYRAGCYAIADVLADHAYTNGYPLGHPDWGGRTRLLIERVEWPASKPVRITETNDNGAYFSAAPHERARGYASYTQWVAGARFAESLSLFTMPGAPDDDSKPAWWFLTPEIVEAVNEVRASFPDNPIQPVEGGTHMPDESGPIGEQIAGELVEMKPTPEQMGGQTLTADGLHAKRWAIHHALPLPEPPPFNTEAGFEKDWLKPANAWWGSPITVNEDRWDSGERDGDGNPVTFPARVFTNVVVIYRNGSETLPLT